MAEYKEVRQFLKDNNITDDQMNYIWKFMYDRNWKVKNLTDSGLDWYNLTPTARLSLIGRFYDEVGKNADDKFKEKLEEILIKNEN
jgi:hypothetical protein